MSLLMAPVTAQSIWYVYGVVSDAFDASGAPPGIDDAPVTVEHVAGFGVLVSHLDVATYDPAAIEASSGDVEWVSPRAVAHDRVLTWASDKGPVVPLPMFSMFTGRAAMSDTLEPRASRLRESLARAAAGREYALRVYRVDAELLANIARLSPRLAELASSAAAATPGQRYLLERKLDAEKRSELRVFAQRTTEEVVDALQPHAVGVARSPIPRVTAAETSSSGTMILNAAFLVADERLDAFRAALTTLVERHTPHGFRFDFTGPWPVYHFVGE